MIKPYLLPDPFLSYVFHPTYQSPSIMHYERSKVEAYAIQIMEIQMGNRTEYDINTGLIEALYVGFSYCCLGFKAHCTWFFLCRACPHFKEFFPSKSDAHENFANKRASVIPSIDPGTKLGESMAPKPLTFVFSSYFEGRK